MMIIQFASFAALPVVVVAWPPIQKWLWTFYTTQRMVRGASPSRQEVTGGGGWWLEGLLAVRITVLLCKRTAASSSSSSDITQGQSAMDRNTCLVIHFISCAALWTMSKLCRNTTASGKTAWLNQHRHRPSRVGLMRNMWMTKPSWPATVCIFIR